MSITERTIKRLFALSGNHCAFPECESLIFDERDGAHTLLGEMCHIRGKKAGIARHDPEYKEVDHYSNIILLCRNHHAIIDQNPCNYSVEYLTRIKTEHESKYKDRQLKLTKDMMDRIKEIILDDEEFNARIIRAQSEGYDYGGHRMEVNANLSWKELFKIIDKDTETIKEYFSIWNKSDESLEVDAKRILQKFGGDLKQYEKFPYHENPFCNRNWELLNLGVDNIMVFLDIHLNQLKINYLTEYIKTNEDVSAKESLQKLRKKLVEAARYEIYAD